MLLRKIDVNFENISSTERFFFEMSGHSVKKWSVYETRLLIQNSTMQGYHELNLRSCTDLKNFLLAGPSL